MSHGMLQREILKLINIYAVQGGKYFTEISWDQRILFVKICKQSVNQLASHCNVP